VSSIPTITSYSNYHYDIAALIPQLQDAMAHSNTPFTKYEHVLTYDTKMRDLATASMPTFLSTRSPIPDDWPNFVPWARRSLAICAAHKIIMIHRKFIDLSFTSSAFASTRKTCVAAAKTILHEIKTPIDKEGPVLWIDQAFTVAAGIILCLDAFHRKSTDSKTLEHRTLAEDAIQFLQQYPTSMIASRGIRLLNFLVARLADQNGVRQNGNGRKRPGESLDNGDKRARISESLDYTRHSTMMDAESQAQPVHIAWDSFNDLFPPQSGFGDGQLFSNFFDFA